MRKVNVIVLIVAIGLSFLAGCNTVQQKYSEPISVDGDLKIEFTGPIGLNLKGYLSLTESQKTLKDYFMNRFGEGLETLFPTRKFSLDSIFLTSAPVEIEGKPIYLALNGKLIGQDNSLSFGGVIELTSDGELLYLLSTLKGMEAAPLRGCVGDKCGFCAKDYNDNGIFIGCKECEEEWCQETGSCYCNYFDLE